MSDQGKRPATFIASALGCLTLTILFGLVAWWLFTGYFAGREDAARFAASSGRRPRGSPVPFLAFLGGVAGLISLCMGGVGIAVVWNGLFGKPPPEKVDESWRNMPAPRDTQQRPGRQPGRRM